MTRIASFIFAHFWNCLAVAAGIAEWILWCVLVGPPTSPAWHLIVPVALVGMNRAAAEACETERHQAPVRSRVGALVLGAGFTSVVGSGALAMLALVMVLPRLFALPALAASGTATVDTLLPPTFDTWATWVVGLAGLVMGYGYAFGHRSLRVRERTLALPGLPPALDGLRLVHLSDLHLGPLADRTALRRAFEHVRALDADLICITGDIVDSPHCDLESWIPELSTLTARHGVVAILGNHDRDSGADRVAEAIERLTSVRLLRDEAHAIRVGDEACWILGLEDRPTADAPAALGRLVAPIPDGAPVVLLAHRPDVFDAAVAAELPLTLAGHTHGGQLAVPGLRHLNVARLLVSSRDVGWFRSEAYRLHVSSGLGVSGQRLRVAVPRDITVIRLVAELPHASRRVA